MTQLVKLAYQVAAMGGQQKKIHDAIFGFSLWKTMHPTRPYRSADLVEHERTLDLLHKQAYDMRKDLESLDFDDIVKRSSVNLWIYEALREYLNAELEAIGALKAICRDLRRETDHRDDVERGNFPKDHKVAYDASVQELKRWGVRLDNLLANY